jgi:peptidylprolyl isomerase
MRCGRCTALFVAGAIAVAGCGGSSSSSSSEPGGGGGQGVKGLTLPPEASDLNVKPVIPKPEGSPPDGLQVRDVVQGTGKVAAAGAEITVQYVGTSWSTGKEFDSTWSRGKQPFTFQLDAGGVIEGWDQGLVGMKQGGRRQLVIPPDLAYGPEGRPPAIAPNETLVFVIDLVKVR